MSAVGYGLLRLRSLRETRGWLGLAGFLLSRLARTQSDVLFERRLGQHEPEPPALGLDHRLVVIDRRNLDDPTMRPLLAELLAGESAAYRPGLEHDDMALAVVDAEGSILHRSFIQFETRYKAILGEADELPLIANCHTVPAARGERLYPKTLGHAAALLARQGYRRVIITCDAKNASSIRGIVKAGFQRQRAITSLVLLFRLAVQRIDWSHGRTSWRVVWI
ncbi:MAG: hypothetical protein ACR2QJ_09275 [Geminicoccaceae bacterium]